MQWLFAIRPVSQVLTVESILGKLRPPEIELSVLNQSGLAAKEFMDGGGTGVEFALDSPFIELGAAEPPEMSKLERKGGAAEGFITKPWSTGRAVSSLRRLCSGVELLDRTE